MLGREGGVYKPLVRERERVMRGRMFMSLPHEPKRSSISPSLPFLTDSLWPFSLVLILRFCFSNEEPILFL